MAETGWYGESRRHSEASRKNRSVATRTSKPKEIKQSTIVAGEGSAVTPYGTVIDKSGIFKLEKASESDEYGSYNYYKKEIQRKADSLARIQRAKDILTPYELSTLKSDINKSFGWDLESKLDEAKKQITGEKVSNKDMQNIITAIKRNNRKNSIKTPGIIVGLEYYYIISKNADNTLKLMEGSIDTYRKTYEDKVRIPTVFNANNLFSKYKDRHHPEADSAAMKKVAKLIGHPKEKYFTLDAQTRAIKNKEKKSREDLLGALMGHSYFGDEAGGIKPFFETIEKGEPEKMKKYKEFYLKKIKEGKSRWDAKGLLEKLIDSEIEKSRSPFPWEEFNASMEQVDKILDKQEEKEEKKKAIKEEKEAERKKNIKVELPKTKPNLSLVGQDGNAFAIMGRAQGAARKAGWSKEQIEFVMTKARSGDYDNLLRVMMEYFEVD